MKILRKIIIPIFSVIVIFILMFTAAEMFPSEVYLLKQRFFKFEHSSFPTLSENIETEKTDIDTLIENGAQLNDSLMLINGSYTLSSTYSPTLTDLGGIYINSCAQNAYYELRDDIKELYDNSLYVMSAYRTAEEQLEIKESEGSYAADTNSSEHLSGLALDIYVKYYAGMGFLDCDEGQFVNSNCQNYGFIIRYPYYGETSTGIPYEPWHIRYVGLPHSVIISENKITLEEYIEYLEPEKFYQFENYIITRQKIDDNIILPTGLSEIVISPDNTGFYIITGKTDR